MSNPSHLHKPIPRGGYVSSKICNIVFFFFLSVLLAVSFLTSSVSQFPSNLPGYHSSFSERLSFRDLKTLRSISTAMPSNTNRRLVIITAISRSAFSYFLNLRCTVKNSTGLDIAIFALDMEVASLAADLRVPVIIPTYQSQGDTPESQDMKTMHQYASAEFNRITKMKFRAVKDTLLAGFDVLFSDVDVVFCNNVVEILEEELAAQSPMPDLLMQSNGFENGARAHMNTGFYYVRSSSATIELFDGLEQYGDEEKNRGRNDQYVFDDYVCATNKGWGRFQVTKVGGKPLGACWWNEKVFVRALSLSSFIHGGIGAGGPVGLQCKNRKIAIWHNNYNQASEKKGRLSDQGLWIIDEKSHRCLDYREVQ